VSQEKNDSGQRVVAPLRRTYDEWHDPFPGGEPTVRIIFHGLFGFFLNDRKCFAGTHNTTQRPGHPHTDHPHEYRVTIVRKDAGVPTKMDKHFRPPGNPLGVSALDFNVTNPFFPGVHVYTGPRHAQFNRSPGDDERDWRWIIDFEDKVYPEGVQGIPDAMKPGVTLNNGLFHTDIRTRAQFDLLPVGGGTAIPLNSIANTVAANIYLTDQGEVRITGGPVGDLPLPFVKDRTYDIHVSNLCNGNNHPKCKYKSNAGTKEGRNDFFLHYETFTIPPHRPEYMLVKRGAFERINDDAPCGAVGYGGTPPP
jgi:hypothetical protein